MKVFKTGAYISADFGFLKKVRDFLPRHFPKAGKRSVKRCRAFIRELPLHIKEEARHKYGQTLRAAADAYRTFSFGILDALKDAVPAVSLS